MNPLDFPLLEDEDIAPDVVTGLLSRGHDVRSVWDEALVGRPDADVLETATRLGRVVVTHDVGFGPFAIRTGTSFVGIVYLRPGHISAAFVLDIVDALRAATADIQVPFIAIAERQDNGASACANDAALVAAPTAAYHPTTAKKAPDSCGDRLHPRHHEWVTCLLMGEGGRERSRKSARK